jgi:hypoxanthine phosphoribosyltransferase
LTVKTKIAFSRERLAKRVKQLGLAISKDYTGRTLDVVMVLENSFMFGADLVRAISAPLVCHFVRSEMRDISMGGFDRREVFFSPPPVLKGRDVLVLDAVLNTGVTQDFLLKRLEEGKPQSLRLAVLFDNPDARKVDLQPEYTGFSAASKEWMGYGLGDRQGLYRNLPYVASGISVPDGGKKHHKGTRKKVS